MATRAAQTAHLFSETAVPTRESIPPPQRTGNRSRAAISTLPQQENAPVQLRGSLEPAILHVRLTDFAAIVELHARPALAGSQLIVCDVATARGTVLAALPAARVQGVQSGAPLRVAEKLCSQPVVAEVDSTRLLAAGRVVQDVLCTYTPLVEPEWVRMDCGQMRADVPRLARGLGAWLDVRGCERLFGPAATIGYLVSVALTERGYSALIGIATSPSLAAIASALASPGEPMLVPAGEERAFLERLPLLPVGMSTPLLDLDAVLLEHLEALGIRRVGDLARLPVASLRRRFGAAGVAAHAQARGEAFRQLTIPIPQETLQAARDLDDPCGDRQILHGELRALTTALAAKLATRAHAAERVTLTISDAHAVHRRSLHLKRPVSTASALQSLVVSLLAQLTPPLGSSGPVHALHLELAGFVPAAAQLALPLFGAGANAAAVDTVAATLRDRFGSRAARRAHLQPLALLPEEQVLWDTPEAPQQAAALVVRVAPDGAPAALQRDKSSWETVCAIHSQWRLRTRWWADTAHRHYYVVETTAGAVLEVYRELPDGPWRLSGHRD